MQRAPAAGVAGLALKVVKLLKWCPLLNSELSTLLGIDEVKLFRASRNFVKKRKSYEIIAGDSFVNGMGNKDRLYKLISSKPAREWKRKSVNKCLHFTDVNFKSEELRRSIHTKMAKERSRLINSGKYNQREEERLCEIFGVK